MAGSEEKELGVGEREERERQRKWGGERKSMGEGREGEEKEPGREQVSNLVLRSI